MSSKYFLLQAEKNHSQLNEYKFRLETALKEKEKLNEKDSEIEQHIHGKQMLDLRIVELEQKLTNLQDAFDIISNQLNSCQIENSQAKVSLFCVEYYLLFFYHLNVGHLEESCWTSSQIL